MSLEIHKKGQGTYARGTAYLLAGLLILFGAIRLYATFNRPGEHVFVAGVPILGDISLYKVLALVAFLLGMLALHLVLNRAKYVDMLIETENEMRKVSWPSWPEVKSATIVVVVVTFIMALSLYAFDKGLQRLFKLFL